MTIIGGAVHIQEIHDFRGFPSEIFFGSKILSSTCNKHQQFDYGCSAYLGNEAHRPDFGRFWTIWGTFRAVCLTLIFLRKISSMYGLPHVVRDFS